MLNQLIKQIAAEIRSWDRLPDRTVASIYEEKTDLLLPFSNETEYGIMISFLIGRIWRDKFYFFDDCRQNYIAFKTAKERDEAFEKIKILIRIYPKNVKLGERIKIDDFPKDLPKED